MGAGKIPIAQRGVRTLSVWSLDPSLVPELWGFQVERLPTVETPQHTALITALADRRGFKLAVKHRFGYLPGQRLALVAVDGARYIFAWETRGRARPTHASERDTPLRFINPIPPNPEALRKPFRDFLNNQDWIRALERVQLNSDELERREREFETDLARLTDVPKLS